MPLSPSSMASMSSIPQYLYQNFTFNSSDLISDFPIPFNSDNTSIMENTTMWGSNQQLDGFINHNNNGALDHVLSLDCDTMACANWIPSFSDQLVGANFSDNNNSCKLGFYGAAAIANSLQNFNGRSYQSHVGELIGEECCGFDQDVKPPTYPHSASENWGIQGNNQMAGAAVEEPNMKVGRYSEEERKERILRYLKKRNQRNFNKTIKYACRKTLADRRVRVRGRFARNNELCDEDMATKKDENHLHHHNNKEDFYGADSIQFLLKNDEEDWLQEAMASLVYLSHSSPEDM